MRIHELPNGDLLYVGGRDMPRSLEGYESDPFEVGLFKLCYPPCIYKGEAEKIKPCKKIIRFPYCHLKKIEINAKICKSCKERIIKE